MTAQPAHSCQEPPSPSPASPGSWQANSSMVSGHPVGYLGLVQFWKVQTFFSYLDALSFLFFKILKINSSWSTVDLQCCVSFRYTVNWISYIYISPLFYSFFSHIGQYRVLSRVLCATQQVLTSYLFLYMHMCSVTSFMSDSATPWTVACQAPLSMGFSRQEH